MNTRSGFNMLQAAVFELNYSIVSKASGLLNNFVKEMNSERTGNGARIFPGKTAVDILSSLDKKERGHADIDKDYNGMVEKTSTFTELHWCSESDDAEKAVELVLNDGVDINIHALCGRTPLMWASISSSSKFVKTLIDLGADVNAQRTDDKVASLLVAASYNNYMATRLLLEHGADANIQASDGYAPLHASVSQGFFKVSQLLIESGCNINLRNKTGRTPLYSAVANNHEQLIKLLLECNADVSMEFKQDPKKRIYLVRGEDKGKPAWHYVMVDRSLLGLFLKRTEGGSLDVKDFGTVLESGWGKDPPENTGERMNKKADSMFKEIPGETLLHVASRNNNPEIFDLLVNYGMWNVNARDAEGFTPLHVAVVHGNMPAVKKLVDLKADASQAIAVTDLAHLNEEIEIEEYLRSKIGSSAGTGKKEVERDVTLTNLLTEARRSSLRIIRSFVGTLHETLNSQNV